MTRLFLAAGVAALAISAPVAAEKGGKGGDNKGQAAKVERGGGKAKAARIEHKGGANRLAVTDRGGKNQAHKADRQINRIAVRGDDRKAAKFDRKGRDLVQARGWDNDRFVPGQGHPLGGIGCPPGLAKQNELCMPPGQYKRLGTALPAAFRNRLLPLGLRDLYRDSDDYYYRLGDGGYLYQVDRRSNLVESLLPLLGGGLMTGQMFPSAYNNYYVPTQYQPFYMDTPDYYYRYNNGYVYQVDRGTSLIQALIPLLTGGSGIGQMLPSSYSMYNVPSQYRSLYYDTPDYQYRYAPGAIYQVDPRSHLITGVPMLLANDLSLGQPLPLGYDAYNVPLAYRANYYDSPTAMYRYNDGYIYQVDPTTRLITAIIDAIV
jgi:hypothetical protein